jgi:hypothetical protein
MNYRLDIIPAQNGWIVNVTFEGHVPITKVFNEEHENAEILFFLTNSLPILKYGFNETLKSWIIFNDNNKEKKHEQNRTGFNHPRKRAALRIRCRRAGANQEEIQAKNSQTLLNVFNTGIMLDLDRVKGHGIGQILKTIERQKRRIKKD